MAIHIEGNGSVNKDEAGKRNVYIKGLKKNTQGLENEVHLVFIDGLPKSVSEE